MENYTISQLQASATAKSLSHPARIAIMEVLLSRNGCVCGELVDELPITQATVSQHLKVLKETGLIAGEVSGTSVCYCIDSTGWERASKQLTALLEKRPLAKGCCAPVDQSAQKPAEDEVLATAGTCC